MVTVRELKAVLSLEDTNFVSGVRVARDAISKFSSGVSRTNKNLRDLQEIMATLSVDTGKIPKSIKLEADKTILSKSITKIVNEIRNTADLDDVLISFSPDTKDLRKKLYKEFRSPFLLGFIADDKILKTSIANIIDLPNLPLIVDKDSVKKSIENLPKLPLGIDMDSVKKSISNLPDIQLSVDKDSIKKSISNLGKLSFDIDSDILRKSIDAFVASMRTNWKAAPKIPFRMDEEVMDRTIGYYIRDMKKNWRSAPKLPVRVDPDTLTTSLDAWIRTQKKRTDLTIPMGVSFQKVPEDRPEVKQHMERVKQTKERIEELRQISSGKATEEGNKKLTQLMENMVSKQEDTNEALLVLDLLSQIVDLLTFGTLG